MAFLDLNHVEMGIRYLRNNLPPGLDQEEEDALKAVVTYFDETYVSGTSRQTGVDARDNPIYRNNPLRYPQPTCNVYLSTISGVSRTNNFCEWQGKVNTTSKEHSYCSLKLIYARL